MKVSKLLHKTRKEQANSSKRAPHFKISNKITNTVLFNHHCMSK